MSTGVVVERLAVADAGAAAAWDEFVLACPQATFFHRAGWQTILRDVVKHDTYFLAAKTGGRITGVLALAHVKSWLFGSSLTSLPFAVISRLLRVAPTDIEAMCFRSFASSGTPRSNMRISHVWVA